MMAYDAAIGPDRIFLEHGTVWCIQVTTAGCKVHSMAEGSRPGRTHNHCHYLVSKDNQV